MSTTPRPETLRRVVELAGRAPSSHNIQPWRWQMARAGLELHLDGGCPRLAADPSGRNAVISCGAALHHLQVVAAALGWRTEVDRVPDRSAASLLARVELRRVPPSQQAESDLRAIAERCTDRRRFTSWPVPDQPLHQLAGVARAQGAQAVPLLAVTERVRAELLVCRAVERLANDQRSAVERQDSERLIARSDGLLVLCSRADDVASWLRAGEGLSALWLAATTRGLSVVPLSQVVEVDETRRALQHDVLGGLAHPQLVVRIGWQEISRRQRPRTARRPVDEIFHLA